MDRKIGGMMPETKVLLGMRIRSLRRQYDYSQEQLAERANISGKYLGEVERGQANISIEVLDKISSALSINVSDLLDFEHELGRKALITKISELIKAADERSLQIVYRMAKAILR
jgi:transcriptional regulator with XRE-family HTH domain